MMIKSKTQNIGFQKPIPIEDKVNNEQVAT